MTWPRIITLRCAYLPTAVPLLALTYLSVVPHSTAHTRQRGVQQPRMRSYDAGRGCRKQRCADTERGSADCRICQGWVGTCHLIIQGYVGTEGVRGGADCLLLSSLPMLLVLSM
eukprot:84189-Rhodomonas_salina.1